jgi:hypothetical protein
MLADNGVLTEFVELDGSDEGVSKEELDGFVASFPVHKLGAEGARW